MVLCNYNQNVVTASSDRTIQVWSPHSSTASSPTLVGRHRDYVRALSWASHPSLLFSGALDRTIAIWDVAATNHETPLMSIDLSKFDDLAGSGFEGERGSVYSLGVDPAGTVLAAGTPERVVRLWDPRVGDKSIARLVGHSECVRSILISDDGRYMLTGSSDSTIKLWSLGEHQCLHTFNYHTSPVWALHSDHPNLERFYSGSRDGVLCAVDLEQVTDLSDGECVVLASEGQMSRESKSGDEGIRAIVGMDDEFVWTATGSSDLKCWKDVGRRITRLSNDGEDDGVGYQPASAEADQAVNTQQSPAVLRSESSIADDSSSLRMEPRDPRTVAFAPAPRPRGDSGATTNMTTMSGITSSLRDRLTLHNRTGSSGAASVISDDDGPSSSMESSTLNGIPYQSLVSLCFNDSPYAFGLGPARRSGDVNDARSIHSFSRNKSDADHRSPAQIARDEFAEREVASEAVPLRTEPSDVIKGRPGLVRSLILNDRQHVLTVDTVGQVTVWDIVRGKCVGKFVTEDIATELQQERGEGLGLAPQTAVRNHSMEVLEMVKERVEGETMVITWCQVDTRIGSLVVHLEESRAFDAEVFTDELGLPSSEPPGLERRINLGQWVMTNLFRGELSRHCGLY